MSAVAIAAQQAQCGRRPLPPPATAAAATCRVLQQAPPSQRTHWPCTRRLKGAAWRAAAVGGGSSSTNRRSSSSYPPRTAAAAGAAAVDLAIEPGPTNSRCIWAGVDVAAPAEAVYAALTSYESLGTFIPGLAENRCLEWHADGCTLLQAGQQEVALGVKFSARVCLRIREWPAGMPRRLLTRGPNSNGGGGAARWWPFGSALSSGIPGYFGGGVPAWAGGSSSSSSAGGSSSGSKNGSSSSSSASGSEEEAVPGEWNERHWLRPRSPLGPAPAMDISFDLVEGDFAAFRGLWRVQAAAPAACRLSYSLFVRPQPWLPVGLVEQRVAGEIRANLAAVRAHVQSLANGG